MLKQHEAHGFLKNQRYRGVYRLPYYRLPDQQPNSNEQAAMDAYVFGGFVNDHGVISTYEKALELYGMFSGSPRKFEIIHCRRIMEHSGDSSDSGLPKRSGSMGFDVAAFGGNFWSIVGDFPDDVRLADFYGNLNDNGLFSSPRAASDYLDAYRLMRLSDYTLPLDVIKVSDVFIS